METKHKYKLGDKLIYEGLIGEVVGLSSYTDGRPSYNLESVEDREMSCTADEGKCELYTDQEIDQTEALTYARLKSARVINMVAGLTDKYYRDGYH